LRFGTETGRFGEEFILLGKNDLPKSRIPVLSWRRRQGETAGSVWLVKRTRWSAVIRRGDKPHGGSTSSRS